MPLYLARVLWLSRLFFFFIETDETNPRICACVCRSLSVVRFLAACSITATALFYHSCINLVLKHETRINWKLPVKAGTAELIGRCAPTPIR